MIFFLQLLLALLFASPAGPISSEVEASFEAQSLEVAGCADRESVKNASEAPFSTGEEGLEVDEEERNDDEAARGASLLVVTWDEVEVERVRQALGHPLSSRSIRSARAPPAN